MNYVLEPENKASAVDFVTRTGHIGKPSTARLLKAEVLPN